MSTPQAPRRGVPETSSTSGDLEVFLDQPAETIDPQNPHIGCWGGRQDRFRGELP
jgi:hypothetical protein